MIPAAAGLGALLFIARWGGAVTWVFPWPPGPFAWADAAGRAAAVCTIAAVTACVFAGFALPGDRARRWLRWRGRTGRPVVGWALGVSLIAAAWEGLGLAGLARAPVAWATVLLLGVPGGLRLSRLFRRLRLPAGAGWLGLVALLALVPALTPEIEVDVLSVHLALPDAWRVAGKITADPGWGVSGFPFAQEALHLPALLTGSEIPARLLGWAGGMLAALGAVALAEAAGVAGAAAWLAGAATFAMPQLFELATHAKNDALAAGLVTAALVALAPGGRAAVATAGVLAGAAVATKLTAALAIPSIGIALLVLRVSPLHLILFLFCSSVPLLPWSLRNLLTLGSPCFPALAGIFPSLGRSAVNAELMSRYAFTWSEVRPATAWAAARDLGRILSGFSPVVGAGAVLWIARRPRPRGQAWLVAFTAVFVTCWVPSLGWVSRYLLPTMPAAVALAAVPFAAVGRPGWLAGLVAASTVFCLGGGGWRAQPLAAAVGLEAPAAYRTRHLRPYQAALEAVTAAVPVGERVVVVGDWRRYPAGGRLVAGMSDDTPLLRTLARDAAGGRRFAAKLRQRRIGWVLDYPSLAAYWADYPMRFPWTTDAARAWAAHWDAHATLVWRSRPAQDPGGSGWLFRLSRGPGEPPFRAWLPGVEGEFAGIRLLLGAAPSAGALRAALDELAPAFADRTEFLSRRAVVRTFLGDRAGAVRDLHDAVRAAPDAVALWAEWGANVVPRHVWDRPDRLAPAFDRLSQDYDRWSNLFNLGIPFAIPGPR